jgi:uncharacterized repeat protein (TIGR01451 family)
MKAAWTPMALLLLLPVAAAGAADLTITKTSTIVSDDLGLLNPRALPGAVVDYAITVRNPNGLTTTVGSEVIADTLPAGVSLRVADLGLPGSGPVEFADGNLLGLGLLGTGLSLRWTALGSATDGVEFWNGSRWDYVPVPDAAGYDPRVRAIRVTLTGGHATGTSYRLRFRTRIN